MAVLLGKDHGNAVNQLRGGVLAQMIFVRVEVTEGVLISEFRTNANFGTKSLPKVCN